MPMSHVVLRASARALVLSVALAGPLAGTVPSYAAPALAPPVVARAVADATPTDLAAKQTGPGELVVEWQAGDEEPAEGYEVRVVGADGAAGPSTVVEPDATWASLVEVPVGTYDLYVTPRVGDGGEAPSATLSGVEVVETPERVTSLAVQQTAPGEVTVTWAAPADDSVEVTGYAVGIAAAQSGNGDDVGPGVLSYTWKNLSPGRYAFSVAAQTADAVRGAQDGRTLVVTNTVKTGAPTLKVADARLKRGQKLVVSGKAVPRSQVQLEMKPAGGQDFFPLRTATAARSGAYRISAEVSSGGIVRAVAVATGRVSPEKAVVVTRTGR